MADIDYSKFLSEDTGSFVPSPTREIFKKVDISAIYSLAGGYPDPSTFPLEIYGKIMQDVIKNHGSKAFLYGGTQGVPELIDVISRRTGVRQECLQVTTSSQQGIDVCARVLIDPGDVVLSSNPTYLGALQSFKSYRAELAGVAHKTDIHDFESAYRKALTDIQKTGKRLKFMYIIPDFQNPSGETLTLDERKVLAGLAEEYDFLIVEDCPYRELRFEGKDIPSIYSLIPERVVQLCSFSKIMSPGFRLGWMAGPPALIHHIYVCKQALDLCPPVFDQYVAAEYMGSGLMDKNLEQTRALYRRKRDIMIEELGNGMPDGVTWTRPEGGMFIFLTFPEWFNTVTLYDEALAAGIGYVSGNMFFTDFVADIGKPGSEGTGTGGVHGQNTMRLNFSFLPEDRLREGVRLLCRLIKTKFACSK